MTLAKVKEQDGMTQQATNLHVRPPFCELRYTDVHKRVTDIKQNGGYFWLKTNYRVYLCCLEFLSRINYPSFFIGRKRFRGVH